MSEAKPFSVKLHEDSFRGYKTDTPSLDVEVSKPMLINMYKEMTLMRRMEMAADALYRAKQIRGFCHLAIGQVHQSLVSTCLWGYTYVMYRKPSLSVFTTR